MAIPTSGPGSQKTFWNTYAFDPFAANTKLGAAGYLGLSTLMSVVAPFWGHALLDIFVRMPFIAKQKRIYERV